MSNILIDLRSFQITQDLIETVALYVSEYNENLIVIECSQKSDLIQYSPGLAPINFAENSALSIRTILQLYCLNNSIYQIDVLVFENSDESITSHTISNINTSNIKSVSELIKVVEAKKAEVLDLFIEENIKNSFSLYLNSIMSLSLVEFEFLMGGSNLNEIQLNMRVNDSTGDILVLKELKELKKHYEKLNSDNNLKFLSYKDFKINTLDSFTTQNFDQFGSLIAVNSYPIVYKYLSSFIYTCAEESHYSANLSVAYLLYFRAFETYCEGALIAKGLAKVENYRNEGKTYQLLYNNSYIKPLGFGKKWGVLKGTNVFQQCCPQDLILLDKHKKLRNIMLYTHGEFVVNSILLIEFKNVVSSIIDKMDINLIQQNSSWKSINLKFNSMLIYNPLKYVANIVIDEAGLKSHAL